ncbi:hypothetical protein AGOR_G00142710 [Albula goreensis]|uniref:Laminin G domain-containing protein n=1 Tax=Albula goreensis TaxID=1534307 RepID=A0A8T3D5L2_9TELE|nr:hypothetical protein AGOR_G00142710 [Albula goreensis]
MVCAFLCTPQRGKLGQDDNTSRCPLPSSVKHAHHLTGPNSYLSYNIPPQVLNHRPHFSVAFRTTSANGPLLFIGSEHGHSHVALYMSNGRLKLSIGDNQPTAHKSKCNDEKWHRVEFSIEMETFHLVVDDLRAVDGVLLHANGSSLGLKPPVYLGSVPQSAYTESQRFFPRESVEACVRNFKMNNQRIEEPSANHGAPPCFDGSMEGGAYFSGNGAYAILDYPNSQYMFMGIGFHLDFEIRPRNLTGVLLHMKGKPHTHLTLFMRKGEIVLQVSSVAGVSKVSMETQNLCDGLFHHVTVARKSNRVQLTVDKKSEVIQVPNSSLSGVSSLQHLYAGGVPDTLEHNKLPLRSSFLGCMRNLQINRKSVSFRAASKVFGPVNLRECPAS